ncbi:retinol-binding protein pinta isoform X2 [Harpegnathos saltator]|uniref:retinol-binding protein pinta isoform X2 n=1 Tax=Harpegnathos saltator TaxID=610380 RepID=UPI000DBED0A2|nr:retinol-binding protein pinta isoform X2 [Harpegnathos saltator]
MLVNSMKKSQCEEAARQLTSEEKEYAAKYLNETDEGRAIAVAEIRRWILENNSMYSRTDEFFILRFLRSCKFDVEKTKSKMRNYHQQRSDLPGWFANKDPLLPELQQLFDLGVFLPLRELDDQGRMVVIVRPTVHDPYKQQLSDLLKQFMNAKLKQRFRVYRRGVTNCCKELPAEILPAEYGGTGCSLQELKEYWKKMAEENRDWFAEDEKYKMLSSAK